MAVAIFSVLPYSGCDEITKVHVNAMSDNPVDLSCSVHNTFCPTCTVIFRQKTPVFPFWTRTHLWILSGRLLLWMWKKFEIPQVLTDSGPVADTRHRHSWDWTNGYVSSWALLANVGTQCVNVNPCHSRKEYDVSSYCSNNAAVHAV